MIETLGQKMHRLSLEQQSRREQHSALLDLEDPTLEQQQNIRALRRQLWQARRGSDGLSSLNKRLTRLKQLGDNSQNHL